jgi:cytochrome c oxidase cbb3-type subunit III
MSGLQVTGVAPGPRPAHNGSVPRPAAPSAAPAGSGRHGNLLDHEYDGIREFDNPTPGWWHLIFGASIIFAVFYGAFWHFSPLASSIHEQWRDREVEYFTEIFGAVGTLHGDETTIRTMMGDQRMLAVAASIFQGNCAACHGKDGSGINGVNLTDDSWKNVKVLPDIFATITGGAANGAMPSWENRLSQNERVILAAYVASLRGTNKPGRPGEGEVIPPFPAPIAGGAK